MKNDILTKVFSFTTVSIFIGVVGFLSGIVQLFIDVNSQISIKWFLLLLVMFLSLIIILLKIIFDLSKFQYTPAFEKPINCMKNQENRITFLIRENEHFKYNIIVAGYTQRNQLDTTLFVGYVEHIQEKMLHIYVVKWFEEINLYDDSGNLKQEVLSSIEVRPVIPRHVIGDIINNGELV
ncbi:MAG: hypothetical protein SOS93_08445 [Mannheimia varigena]|nr:hypothetical protein [Mannheimia varigena]